MQEVELWELKVGDVLDFHIVWAGQLQGGRTIATQEWQIVTPPAALLVVAQGQNAVDRVLQGNTYRPGTISTAWIRTLTAAIGDVVKVTATITTDHSQPLTITATRYIEIVRVYAHERADPAPVRRLSAIDTTA